MNEGTQWLSLMEKSQVPRALLGWLPLMSYCVLSVFKHAISNLSLILIDGLSRAWVEMSVLNGKQLWSTSKVAFLTKKT